MNRIEQFDVWFSRFSKIQFFFIFRTFIQFFKVLGHVLVDTIVIYPLSDLTLTNIVVLNHIKHFVVRFSRYSKKIFRFFANFSNFSQFF